MTLEEHYEVCKSGTRVFLWDEDNIEFKELPINKDTDCGKYDVIGYSAEENDLIYVYVE